MKKYTYIAILTPDLECDAYNISFPDLAGCLTCGNNIADAYYMAHDALEGYLSVSIEDGHKLPIPTDLKDIELKKEQYTMIVQVKI